MPHAIRIITLSTLLLATASFAQSTRPDAPPPPPPDTPQTDAPSLPDDAIARALQDDGRWVEAADLYLQVTEAQPDNAAAWFNLGYCLHMAGELDLAINAHRKAATFEQYTGIALYNLGCAHALLGESDEALEALDGSLEAGFDLSRHLDTDPDLASLRADDRFAALRERAEAMAPSRVDSMKQAVQQARQYLAEHGPALLEKARAMARQAMGAAEQKVQELRKVAEDDEKIAAVRARLKEAFARAHEAFLKWRQQNAPDQPSGSESDVGPTTAATMDKADQLFQQGDWTEAAAAYRTIVEVEPDNARAWFNLGYALHAAGRLDEAIDADRRAAEFEQFRGIALYNLACAHALRSEADAAFEALRLCREAGFDRLPNMVDDSDFDNIRNDPRFDAFVASLRDHDGS